MYHHIKKLMYTVNVGTPDPRFGNMLLEQFGGANGSWLPPCNIRFKDSTAKTRSGKTS
jgi:Mn-containing catalase